MESQDPRVAEPYLRPEDETEGYTRIHNLDPDEAQDEQVDDDDIDEE